MGWPALGKRSCLGNLWEISGSEYSMRNWLPGTAYQVARPCRGAVGRPPRRGGGCRTAPRGSGSPARWGRRGGSAPRRTRIPTNWSAFDLKQRRTYGGSFKLERIWARRIRVAVGVFDLLKGLWFWLSYRTYNLFEHFPLLNWFFLIVHSSAITSIDITLGLLDARWRLRRNCCKYSIILLSNFIVQCYLSFWNDSWPLLG